MKKKQRISLPPSTKRWEQKVLARLDKKNISKYSKNICDHINFLALFDSHYRSGDNGFTTKRRRSARKRHTVHDKSLMHSTSKLPCFYCVVPVSDIQIMTKVLCTLPPSYRAFITAWDSVPAAEKTIALLMSRLLKEETMAKWYKRGQRDAQGVPFFVHYHSSSQQMDSPDKRDFRGRGGFNRRSSFRRHPYNPNFYTYCGLGPHKAAVCGNRI
jgi:hypothetical protein